MKILLNAKNLNVLGEVRYLRHMLRREKLMRGLINLEISIDNLTEQKTQDIVDSISEIANDERINIVTRRSVIGHKKEEQNDKL